jgi:hypothetical protein
MAYQGAALLFRHDELILVTACCVSLQKHGDHQQQKQAGRSCVITSTAASWFPKYEIVLLRWVQSITEQ